MVGQWLSYLGVAVVVIVFMGSAVVYLRGSYDKGEINRLDRAVRSRDREIGDLTTRVDRHEKTIAEQGAKIKALERENTILRGQRPSADVLAAMDEFLHKHDEVAREILEIVRNGD